jgi:hypothetical protein
MGEPKGCAMPGCCAAELEIATLRAEVERWVKEVAHLKLAAEKAERDIYGYVRNRMHRDEEDS